MRQIALALVVVACKSEGDDYAIDPDHPIVQNPGNKPDAGTVADAAPMVDGGPTVDGGSGMITGRICVVSDPRTPDTGCSTSANNAGGARVALGANATFTANDGTFTLAQPTGTNLVWHVSGQNLYSSVMPFGTGTTIPAMTLSDYADLQNNNGVVPDQNDGDLFVRVTRGGAALANAKGASTPASFAGPLYDGATLLVWKSGSNQATGALGTIWLPTTPIGAASVSVTPMGATAPIVIPGVPVEAESITWISVDVP